RPLTTGLVHLAIVALMAGMIQQAKTIYCSLMLPTGLSEQVEHQLILPRIPRPRRTAPLSPPLPPTHPPPVPPPTMWSLASFALAVRRVQVTSSWSCTIPPILRLIFRGGR